MNQKKQTSNWLIALGYYITVSLFAVGGWMIGLVMLMVLNLTGIETLKVIVFPVAEILIMWLIVVNVAKKINNSYMIQDSRKVLNITMAYVILITFPLMAFVALSAPQGSVPELVSFIVTVIGMTVILYMASRKYLK